MITENGDTASAINDRSLQGNVFGLVARLHNGMPLILSANMWSYGPGS